MADDLREAIKKRQADRDKRVEAREKKAKKRQPVKLKIKGKEVRTTDPEQTRKDFGIRNAKPKSQPIDDRSANPPERRPRPMIQPLNNTAPPQQLRSQAAHTYGYTPEWYKETRDIPIRINKPEDRPLGDYGADAYYPKKPRDARPQDYVQMYSDTADRTSLAHEQAHAYQFRHGFEEPGPSEQYREDFNRWRAEQPDNFATDVTRSQFDSGLDVGLYDEEDRAREEMARTVQFSPLTTPEGYRIPPTDRSEWPDYVRPYYRGMLQGMDRQQDGSPTPPLFTPANRRWR